MHLANGGGACPCFGRAAKSLPVKQPVISADFFQFPQSAPSAPTPRHGAEYMADSLEGR